MRRTILLVATMTLTLLVASGVALATGIGSAGAKARSLGRASPSRRPSTLPIQATPSSSGEFTERT